LLPVGDEFQMNFEVLGVPFSTYLLFSAAFCELGANFAENVARISRICFLCTPPHAVLYSLHKKRQTPVQRTGALRGDVSSCNRISPVLRPGEPGVRSGVAPNFVTNFREFCTHEVRRIPLLGNQVNELLGQPIVVDSSPIHRCLLAYKQHWALGKGAIVADDISGSFDWKREEGRTIRLLLTEHPYTDALLADLKSFKDKTGIDVEHDIFPEENYFDEVTRDLSSRQAN
jgi:hypothetical protein